MHVEKIFEVEEGSWQMMVFGE